MLCDLCDVVIDVTHAFADIALQRGVFVCSKGRGVKSGFNAFEIDDVVGRFVLLHC